MSSSKRPLSIDLDSDDSDDGSDPGAASPTSKRSRLRLGRQETDEELAHRLQREYDMEAAQNGLPLFQQACEQSQLVPPTDATSTAALLADGSADTADTADTRLPLAAYKECRRKDAVIFGRATSPAGDAKRGLSLPNSSAAAPQPGRTTDAFTKGPVAPSKGTFGFRLIRAFGVSDWHNRNAFSIKSLLSDLDLQSSVQFNYMVNLDWVMSLLPEQLRDKPMTIVHGLSEGSADELARQARAHGKVVIKPALPIAYGTHHTKMMFLFYSDSLRVVIHTSNMIPADWYAKTQGAYISPKFPLKTAQSASSSSLSSTSSSSSSSSSSAAAPSSTGQRFEKDLIDYLLAYGPSLSAIRSQVAKYDFSQANVALIGSVPGRHRGENKDKWGHLKLRKVLRSLDLPEEVASQPMSRQQIVGQFSSIGALGASPDKWLTGEFLDSLSSCSTKGASAAALSKPRLRLVFPTVENVRSSLEGYLAGGSIPYRTETHQKQTWLSSYFCSWNAEHSGRQLAMPHFKSYARYAVLPSPPASSSSSLAPRPADAPSCALGWFLVTSANLSKAAWGQLQLRKTDNEQLEIRSYELGVLFHPALLFPTGKGRMVLGERCTCPDDVNIPVPYDLPPVSYTSADKPWVGDVAYSEPDSHGDFWPPRDE